MEFEEECTTKLKVLEKFLNNHLKEDKKPTKSNSTYRSPIEEVKLPKMEIRQFSGDPTKWQTFYESLKISVHASSLSNVQKCSYLIRYVEDDALNVISGLALLHKITRKR